MLSNVHTTIIGGGIVGSSVLYHLSKTMKDVVLLEQEQLTSGSTWHAAGIIGQIRNSITESRMSMYSSKLYSEIERENPIGWKKCGAINLATTKKRHLYFNGLSTRLKHIGLEMESVEPSEIGKMTDLIKKRDIYSGWIIPNDGVVNSSDVSIALCNMAKKNGAKIKENVCVKEIKHSPNEISIKTTKGEWQTKNVVVCTGMWTKQFLKHMGISIPLHPCHHFYAITEPYNIDTNLPIIRDPDNYIYLKEWSKGLCFGGFEPNAKICFTKGIPKSIPFHLFNDDWDQFEPLLEASLHRVPTLHNIPIRKLYNGPESFTPDMSCIVDQVKDNIYVAAGCNSSGIAMAGGIGKTIAELIEDGETEWDISNLSLSRFSKKQLTKKYLFENISKSLSNHYK